MITVFYILFALLVVNALLLIFSVNGAFDNFKRPFQKIAETPVTKLFPTEYSETKYKKAV